MDMQMTTSTQRWFEREWNLSEGDAVRFFVRYCGDPTTRQPGFSVGISLEEPKHIAASVTHAGVQFFVRDEDLWFFDNNPVVVDYAEASEEFVW